MIHRQHNINGLLLLVSFLTILQLFVFEIGADDLSAIEESKSETERLKFMGRIVNGSRASFAQFPHQVSLRYSWNGGHFCGGSIIDAQWILTAAHCTFYQAGLSTQPWMIVVVAGDLWLNESSVTSQYRTTSRIIVHENYNDVTYENDVALLKLNAPIIFEYSTVGYQVLQNRALPAGTMCQVAGWGYPAEDILLLVNELMYVDLPIVSQELCRKLYSEFIDVPEGMMCAGYIEGMKDACQGDSGGGLICEGILTGIVSSGNGCAWPGYPGIYTNVSHYRDWILRSSGIDDRNGASGIRFFPWTSSMPITITWLIVVVALRWY